MLKISFIGAGSLVFGRNILTDLLTFPIFHNNTIICLEDIDPKRLDLMYDYILKYKQGYPKDTHGITIEKTTNQKKAVEDAKYIINAVHVGGLDAFKLDIEIPFKYGISQCVGDTLGPGGVFRFLRSVPFFKSLLNDIKDVGYKPRSDDEKPLILNYTNPMAMNTWFCNAIQPKSTIGLCHSVQGTAAFLRNVIGSELSINLSSRDFSYNCAGINHMAWFLEAKYKDPDGINRNWIDAYPILNKLINKETKSVLMEKVRFDMMKATGLFVTESSGHLSEYLPYYRKRENLLEEYKGRNHGHNSLKHSEDYFMQVKNQGKMEKAFKTRIENNNFQYKEKYSGEYGTRIINALETGEPFRFNGNILNKEGAFITNLPKDCCVEMSIFADRHGLHPQGGIELPTACQALCISNIMVQKAAVEGVLELDKEKIYHAVLLDPNTASVCSPREIREMVDEMLEKEAKWIPKF
ncbi:MAG: family 4 glycosyl hydrolase [Promethearchaeota archaeon]|jgi:alpha-galactosidase